MSKPMAVSLPFVLLILDWYPFERITSLKTFRTAFTEKAPVYRPEHCFIDIDNSGPTMRQGP